MNRANRSWPMQALLYLWVAPTTAVGLFFGLIGLLTGGRVARVGRTLEFHGGLVRRWLRVAGPPPEGAWAQTIGHVILGQTQETLDHCRVHENIHVDQCERWGPLFIPAYFLASGWQWCRGRRAYYDNPFEREAFTNDGSGRHEDLYG
jgi:hypothetical protein